MAAASDHPPGRSSLHPSLVGQRLGAYEVLTQLASGGMATVYIARRQGIAGFERLVAIKVLHPHLAHEEEFISMFLDEARLAARIHHPNVVPTLDISDTERAGYFLVMQYIEGDHLGALLQEAAKRKTPMPARAVVRSVLDALSGLSAAHRLTDEDGRPLNLVHRDVSPHNVIVGVDGIARLTDFGVAKAEVRLSSTREGQFKGKLSYMAPEQAESGYADQRSDLFSMGIMLWESLAGRRLFRGENNAETLNRILKLEVPPPSSRVREAAPFDEVCLRALRRDPERRFQTADEFALALEEAATAAQCLATSREVSDLAKTLAADKLEKERQRVRQAIVMLGRSEMGDSPVLPISIDGADGSIPVSDEFSSVTSRTSNESIHGSGETRTMAARPSSMRSSVPAPPMEASARTSTGRRSLAIVATAATVLLGLASGVYWFSSNDDDLPIERQPAQAEERDGNDRAREDTAPRQTSPEATDDTVGTADLPPSGNDAVEDDAVEDDAADHTEATSDTTLEAGNHQGEPSEVDEPTRIDAEEVRRRQPAGGRRPTPRTEPGAEETFQNPYRR